MNDATPSSDPIDVLIASYVQAVETGQVPDRRSLLERHPDHAEALQTFFADFDRMDRVAAPLRMAGDDETIAVASGLAAQPPTVRYFGDYELLEEIARGGMGVVYKARQASLNRIVALKMILAGTFATPREVARFQAEAEAAANLDHPGIVPVYEVGEYEGQQYFSMKFLEGGSLAHHPRASIKLEVLGLIAIAQAVHHAHQHGVLHRDLKPANVLVDPSGNRHVTDFGLAKRLSDVDRSLTEAGQILGTPRYMSPEQALGRKDLTVAADIYALGVILYERLTGQTPFDGDNALELLRQVRETNPPRPSAIRPDIDRDLETIVLKCLETDPARRYPTAFDLVEDLDRWLEGRPIAARPVGQAERFARWCRRNPVVAGLAASVAAALILGIVSSSLFALQERKARVRAEVAEDGTERALARSLVRPLNPDFGHPDGNPANHEQDAALSEPELDALWELAASPSESLRTRFLEQAVGHPLALRQLRARSGPALLASIGLDPDRRSKAIRSLGEALDRVEADLPARVDLALLLVNLGQPGEPAVEKASTLLIEALAGQPSKARRGDWECAMSHSLDSRNSRLTPRLLFEAMRHRGDDLDAMLSDSNALNQACTRLVSPESRSYSGQAARLLLARLEMKQDPKKRRQLADFLNSLADRLDPDEARRLCGQAARTLLADAITAAPPKVLSSGWYEDDTRPILLEAIPTLSKRVGIKETAGKLIKALGEAQRQQDGLLTTALSATLLKVLATGPDPRRTGDSGESSRGIVSLMERETSTQTQIDLARALVATSAQMELAESRTLCRRAARLLISKMPDRHTDFSDAFRIGSAVAAVTSRLEPAEASRLCAEVARLIFHPDDLAWRTDPRRELDGGYVEWIYPLMLAIEPVESAEILLEAIEHPRADELRDVWVTTLDSVVNRLEAADAARICARAVKILVAQVDRMPNDTNRKPFIVAIIRARARTEPKEAIPALLAILEGWKGYDDVVGEVATALLRATTSLGPTEATRVCGQAARTLLPGSAERWDSGAKRRFAYFLATVAGGIEPSETLRLHAQASPINCDIERENYRDLYWNLSTASTSLAMALSTASTKLEPGEAARILIEAIGEDPREQSSPIAINALYARFKPGEYLDIGTVIGENPLVGIQQILIHALASACEKLEPAEASRVSLRAILAHLKARPGTDQGLPTDSSLDAALAALFDQLEPKLAESLARNLAPRTLSSKSPTLAWLLADSGRKQKTERAYRLATGTLQYGTGQAMIQGATDPYPCRLSTAELVELLKMPTCLGESRRVVLEHLGNIHGRRFANHWEFVRFAREKGLKLDFTSPPRRPDPKASMEDLLIDLPR